MSTRPYLGNNVNPGSAEELRHRSILEEDELLLALFDGVLLDDKRRRIGGLSLSDFVVLTDRRLVTWARGFFNDTVDSFPWQDVDVAKAETWDPWHGRVVMAFRLPAVAPRTRRIAVRGTTADRVQGERVIVNTLDYMPTDDVTPLSNMIAWIGDQVIVGVAGEQLVAAFTAQFPAPERQSMLAPSFTPPPPPPPAPARSVDKPRRRWWQRAVDGSEDAPKSTGNLIADYENRRSSLPAGDGTPALPMSSQMVMPGQMPGMPEQPSMYEMSRTLQLFLEAPRRLAQSVRRAGEVMSGATDLVSGMQDPKVRRNAMFGIYQAAAQQEATNGPFASVGPVVRAVVRFSEPLPDEAAEAEGQAAQPQARRNRIEVRTPTRRSPPTLAEAQPAPAPVASPPPAVSVGPVRRSVSVRRAEAAPAEAAPAETAPKEPAPAAPAAESVSPVAQRSPARRLAISRIGDESEPQQQSVVASVSDGERQ
ncbi:MAG: hypothetical protein WCI67_02430 [Chloroflexales bacterium]